MKKKAIEKNTVFRVKENQQKERCQIHWCHGGQDCWTRKASFPGGIQEQKRIKRNTDGADRAHKKGFRHILAGKGRMDEAENKAGQLLWPSDMGRRTSHMGAGEKRKYTPEHRGSGKDKEVLQSQRIQRGALVGIHIQT